MNIALDYDGTFTEDPVLWLRFILDAQSSGHDIRVVTMRFPSEAGPAMFDPRLKALGVQVICTCRLAKRDACMAQGWTPHVWIDDNPRAVQEDAMAIWKESAPEGQPVVPTHG